MDWEKSLEARILSPSLSCSIGQALGMRQTGLEIDMFEIDMFLMIFPGSTLGRLWVDLGSTSGRPGSTLGRSQVDPRSTWVPQVDCRTRSIQLFPMLLGP